MDGRRSAPIERTPAFRRPRRTIRLRLTLMYGAVFLAAGTMLLALTYVLAAHALPWLGLKPPSPPDLTLRPDQLRAPEVTVPGPDRIEGRPAGDPRQFVVASGLALAFMTAVSVGLGWLMAGRMLSPLRAMTATTRAISARTLHQRLDVRGPDDEIKDLADTFDELLGRLEAAFEAQRRFVANASHELRTPLTFERSLLEVTLADPEVSVGTLRTACERVLASNRHQERLIEALLALARGQRGLDHREDLDLAPITGSLLETTGPQADSLSLHVTAELNPAPATGDPHLIERLVGNLIDNAVRHNRPGGRITIWTGLRTGLPTLEVTNTGPAVPEDRLETLFHPFERLEATRTGNTQGLGLGLSIVKAITTAHAADLTAAPNPEGGLTLQITFPSPWPPESQDSGSA